MAVHVVLNAVGAEFKLQNVSLMNGEHKKPEFLKINPRGQVPVLVEGDKVLREGAAIITYLCDKYKSPLLPADGWARAEALQWLMYGNATLHVAYSKAAFINRNMKDGAEKTALLTLALDQIQDMWNEIEMHLETSGKMYLAGDNITAGDILVTVIANWSFLPRAFTFGPKSKALFKAVITHPAYAKAIATEQVEYKAAA
jgi:glutathione S-transferase